MLRGLIRSPGFWGRAAAVIAGGLLLACAYPLPPALGPLEGASTAWLALVPLIMVARCGSRRAAFGYGWLGGMAFWLLTLVWVLQLRHTWGYLPVVILCWIALAGYCALYTALFGRLVAAWFPWPSRADAVEAAAGDRDPSGRAAAWRELLLLPALPVLWAGLEMMRGHLFTGFPWNALGVSQARNIGLLQLAALGGVPLLSALVMLVNTALALMAFSAVARITGRGPRRRFHPELMLALVAVAGGWVWGTGELHRIEREADVTGFQTGLIQPAIPQPAKWDDAAADATYATLHRQSELALYARPDLLIWPETAIPDVYRYEPYAQSVVRSIVTNGVPLLLGTMDMQEDARGRLWFNSALLVAPDMTIVETYHKRHLVPFGEYIPFERTLPLLGRLAPLGFSCTPGEAPVVFRFPVREREGRPAATVPFAVLICFEDIMAAQARDAVRAGARALVNLTNDAWFDGSSAAEQHMLHAVFRAVENRVPMIRSTNTGLSAFIERTGRIKEALWLADRAAPVEGFAVNTVAVPHAAPTSLYARIGAWSFGWPAMGLTLVALVATLPVRWPQRAKGSRPSRA